MQYLLRGFLLKTLTPDPLKWRRKAVRMVSDTCRKLLASYQYDIEYTYARPDLFSEGKSYLMVSNHMSYMDIVLLSAGEPAVFVTSMEMKNTPFLGDVSAFGGSYFVERRSRSQVQSEVRDLAQLLRDGFHVFVFPEATSTHGLHVLPFKRALFTAAIEAQKDVLPVCIRVEEIDGEPFQEKNHRRTSWYDKMEFFPHLLQFMAIRKLRITVNYLEPIKIQDFPDRVSLAQKAHEQIVEKYLADRPPEFEARPMPSKKEGPAIASKDL